MILYDYITTYLLVTKYAKYAPGTLIKALLFRRRLTMMFPLGIIYVFIFISH